MGAVAVGVAIGAVVGGAAAAIQSGGDFNAIWKGALIGGVAGGVGGAVAGWAAPALAPTFGSYAGIAAGALGGGAAGLIGGVGNAALNGGNSTDYLKGGLFGTLGGAAVGGITAGLTGFGSGEVAAPGTAELPGAGAAPGAEAGTQGITTGTTGVAPAAESLTSGAAPIGTGTEATSGSVFQSTPTQTAPSLNDMYAANTLGSTATDIGGSSAIPQQLSGGYVQPEIGDTSSLLSGWGSTGQSSANTAMQSLGLGTSGEGFSTGFTPNMSTPSNPYVGGGDYGITTNTGQVLDSSGNVLGNAPGWEAEGVPTVRGVGSDYTGSDSGWSMDKLFDWGTGKNTMKALAAGQLLSGGLKALSAGATAPETNQNKQQLMDLYNLQKQNYQQQMAQQQADAARNQQIYEQNKQAFQNNLETQAANRALLNEQQANAAGYNKQLSETYTNPNAYLNTPEAQAARSMAMQKLLAQNTAAGRRSAGLGLQNQLMMSQLGNLGAYRQGLNSAIRYPGYLGGMSGMSYAPQTQANATGMLGTLSSAQSYSPTADVLGGLNTMATPLTLSYLFS